MKLYTMKYIKDPERMDECFEPDNQEEQYFVKLETKAEDERYYSTIGGFRVSYQDYEDWNDYMIPRLGEADAKTDDDVYGYIVASSPEIACGNTYEDADGLVWERVE